MKLAKVLLDILIFLLGVYECQSQEHGREKLLSLVQLFRYKRFDYTMFGCSDCRPVMECHSDSYCKYIKGHQYTCEFRCCSFSCVDLASNPGGRASHAGRYQNDEADDDITGSGNGENQQSQYFTTKKPMKNYGNTQKLPETMSTTRLQISIEETTPMPIFVEDDEGNEDG